MELIRLIDILGIAAFSISGAFAAMQRKLDVFGVLVIAFITALGGGTLRDILIGDVPVSWMYNLNHGVIVLLSSIAAMLFTNAINNYRKILLAFDSLGLGFFTVVGMQKAINIHLHPAICITLGTITACFGGVIRDISLNHIPLIFQKEIYATACIFGGVIYFLLLKSGLPKMMPEAICISAIVILRLISVRYKWQLPSLWRK
jgi:uncharacterized membrane protein YeiH